MNPKIKSLIVNLLKFVFAGAIFYYLISTDKIKINQLKNFSSNYIAVIEVVLTILACYSINTIRWYFLIKWQGIPTTLLAITRINCIGIFFNSFMPGTVGGDIVKAVYVAKENKEYRTRAITTILIDRILGLETLMIVASVALAINYQTVIANPLLQTLSLFIGGFLVLSFIGALAVFSKRVNKYLVNLGVGRLASKLPFNEVLKSVYNAFHIYSDQKSRILKVMLMTIPLDIFVVCSFLIIGNALGENTISVTAYFTAIPVALLVASMPFTPGGLGTGSFALNQLFFFFGGSTINMGGEIILIFQVITILVNMLFVVFYLSNKKEVQEAMADVSIQD